MCGTIDACNWEVLIAIWPAVPNKRSKSLISVKSNQCVLCISRYLKVVLCFKQLQVPMLVAIFAFWKHTSVCRMVNPDLWPPCERGDNRVTRICSNKKKVTLMPFFPRLLCIHTHTNYDWCCSYTQSPGDTWQRSHWPGEVQPGQPPTNHCTGSLPITRLPPH